MTYDELINAIIEKLDGEPGDYIVELDYCYIDDYGMCFDEMTSYELFTYDGQNLGFLNDWWEGQQYCSFGKITPFDELLKAWQNVKKIEGLTGRPEDCWAQTMTILGI